MLKSPLYNMGTLNRKCFENIWKTHVNVSETYHLAIIDGNLKWWKYNYISQFIQSEIVYPFFLSWWWIELEAAGQIQLFL